MWQVNACLLAVIFFQNISISFDLHRYFIALIALVLVEAALSFRCKNPLASFWRAFPSSLLACLILVYSLPSQLPLVGILVGTCMCLLVGKYLWGGLGQNFMNPAMLAYLCVYWLFPESMAQLDGKTSQTLLLEQSGLTGAVLSSEAIFVSLLILGSGAWFCLCGIVDYRYYGILLLGGVFQYLVMNHSFGWDYLLAPTYLFAITFVLTDPVGLSYKLRDRLISASLFPFILMAFQLATQIDYPIALAVLSLNILNLLINSLSLKVA